jgi:hypothetical protein
MFFGEDNKNPVMIGYWLEKNIKEKVKVIKKQTVKKPKSLKKIQ